MSQATGPLIWLANAMGSIAAVVHRSEQIVDVPFVLGAEAAIAWSIAQLAGEE